MQGESASATLNNALPRVICRMTEHDLLEVVEIEEESGLSRWGFEAYHEELMRVQRALMFVAKPADLCHLENGKNIFGFIASGLISDELHINNVAVREEYRRSGVGNALLSTVIKEGAVRGARQAFLEVRASNTAAQALYARCGFKIIGQRRGYYTDPSEDALVMSRAIESGA